MAGQTEIADVGVAVHVIVFRVHFRLSVLVTTEARECHELCGCAGVTIKAGSPFASMLARIDREVGGVVLSEVLAVPIVLGVAGEAGFRESAAGMLQLVVWSVTGDAVISCGWREE
jgi:hypothetical protein